MLLMIADNLFINCISTVHVYQIYISHALLYVGNGHFLSHWLLQKKSYYVPIENLISLTLLAVHLSHVETIENKGKEN